MILAQVILEYCQAEGSVSTISLKISFFDLSFCDVICEI